MVKGVYVFGLFVRLPLRYLRRLAVFPLLDQIKPIGRLVPVN